jgi:hypothetical protein
MPVSAGRTCWSCESLSARLPARGLSPWFLVLEWNRHYLATVPAMRVLRSGAPPPTVLAQIDAIATAGRVAWVDVNAQGAFVAAEAPHGMIPTDLPLVHPP